MQSCDELAISLLNAEERAEAISSLKEGIVEHRDNIKSLEEEYSEFQADGQYDEMEDTLNEICSLKEELSTKEEKLSEFYNGSGSKNSYY